jgi:flagellar basal body-associated protein FliL
MSDEAAPKKKGGKLPIIIALVAVLGGGGFFMMKGKKDDKKEPEIALGAEEVLLPDEYIVNMADGQTYIRARIGLRPKKEFKAEMITKHDAEISDVIVRVLKTTKPEQTVSEKDIKQLKMRIATGINKILAAEEEAAHGTEKKKKKKKKKTTKDEESEHSEESTETEELPDEDWDSAEGPILKVFFKTLATQ